MNKYKIITISVLISTLAIGGSVYYVNKPHIPREFKNLVSKELKKEENRRWHRLEGLAKICKQYDVEIDMDSYAQNVKIVMDSNRQVFKLNDAYFTLIENEYIKSLKPVMTAEIEKELLKGKERSEVSTYFTYTISAVTVDDKTDLSKLKTMEDLVKFGKVEEVVMVVTPKGDDISKMLMECKEGEMTKTPFTVGGDRKLYGMVKTIISHDEINKNEITSMFMERLEKMLGEI